VATNESFVLAILKIQDNSGIFKVPFLLAGALEVMKRIPEPVHARVFSRDLSVLKSSLIEAHLRLYLCKPRLYDLKGKRED
jgi:hypothetical protein